MVQAKNKFTPSHLQKAIFDHISDPTKKNLVVEAVAGSGKTTTITEATKLVPSNERLLFVAFNKRNVEDLKPRLPANAEAATLNSVGHRTWMRFIGGPVELVSSKTYKLIDEFFPDFELTPAVRRACVENYIERFGDSELKKYEASLDRNLNGTVDDLHRLISMAKGAGLVPKLAQAKRNFDVLLEDTRENWLAMIEGRDLDIERPDIAIELARRVLDRSIEISNEEIDFDDQLYLPIIFRAKFYQFPWVFVDEAQDLNRIQHAIVKAVTAPGGRVVAVGDRRQAIYGFRGSCTNSMDLIRSEFDAHELPLSICYRCGKKIVELAQSLVPHIQPHADKHDGEVINLEIYGPKQFGKDDAVLCRNTRPLISLAYKLIRAGVSCRVLGRDIEHGLVRIIKKMKAKTVDELEDKLGEYQKREAAKFRRRKQEERAQSLIDRLDTVRVFINELHEGNRSIDKLIASINKLFKMDQLEKKQMLVLSTVHRAKGGEWDNVFILDPELMPSKWASSEEALQQELNLKYVAYTRAIRKLYFIKSDGFEVQAGKKVA